MNTVTTIERVFGFPAVMEKPLYLFDHDINLKTHQDYIQAKAGDQEAAVRLVWDLAHDFLLQIKSKLSEKAIYVAPFAKEATGDNAIPQVLAVACAMLANGEYDEGIVQVTRVYHTGADPMERLSLRPQFEGAVTPGAKYVLVDDLISMGGTLAELANYIRLQGGEVVDVVVLVNAGRNKHLNPSVNLLNKLKKRYEHEIREIFGVHVTALTANEASYLIGFRSSDEIRNRLIKARKETNLRIRSKGIQREV